MNLKEHDVLPHFPCQNSWLILSLEHSIILKVHLWLCVRSVSAYDPRCMMDYPWQYFIKNVTHYKYAPAARNERTASAGTVLTPSAGMWHTMRTQALLRQLHIAPSTFLNFLFWIFPTIKCQLLTLHSGRGAGNAKISTWLPSSRCFPSSSKRQTHRLFYVLE